MFKTKEISKYGTITFREQINFKINKICFYLKNISFYRKDFVAMLAFVKYEIFHNIDFL